VLSYYAVSVVACLEWHARSRFVDLLSFRPEGVRADDLKGQLNDKVLSQMVAQGVGIPHLLGALLAIGSSQKYIGIFERLFSELNITPTPYDLLNPIILSDEETFDGSRVNALQVLFESRHSLVHEIDLGVVGNFNQRTNLDLDGARDTCTLALKVMRTLEKALTEKAPRGFPNRLDVNGHSEDQIAELDVDIARIEEKIAVELIKWRSEEDGLNPNIEDWQAARSLSARSRERDSKFVDSARFLFNRYVDLHTPIKMALRRGRLEYVRLLEDVE
jgi:hypothetical protein